MALQGEEVNTESAPAERGEKDESNLVASAGEVGSITKSQTRLCIRYGWVTSLPKGFTGERHTVVVKCDSTGSPHIEWCEFEEREGLPAPVHL